MGIIKTDKYYVKDNEFSKYIKTYDTEFPENAAQKFVSDTVPMEEIQRVLNKNLKYAKTVQVRCDGYDGWYPYTVVVEMLVNYYSYPSNKDDEK